MWGLSWEGPKVTIENYSWWKIFELWKCLENFKTAVPIKERRNALCLKFAQICLLVPKFKEMFPRNKRNHDMGKRRFESFQVKRALTERLRRSAIPYMQRLLNEHEKKKNDICRQISNFNPVNNGLSCKSVSLRH